MRETYWIGGVRSVRDVPPPQEISVAQLLIGLVSKGWITEDAGDKWLAGTALPEAVATYIRTLPEAEQFPARARAMRMSVARRDDPLVIALAEAEGKTPIELDHFFATFAKI